MRKMVIVMAFVVMVATISLPGHAGIFKGKQHKCDFTEAKTNDELIKAAGSG